MVSKHSFINCFALFCLTSLAFQGCSVHVASITLNGTVSTTQSAAPSATVSPRAQSSPSPTSSPSSSVVVSGPSLSIDASLKGLVLSSGTLSPSFSSGTTSYIASISNSTTSITVTPTVNQANATVTVNGDSPTTVVPMSVGPNSISIVVTAQDGSTKETYLVTVTRAFFYSFAALDTINANVDGSPAGGGLVQSGSTFYGMAIGGGTYANGTIFKITTSGVYTKLHDFSAYTGGTSNNSDGAAPDGSLIFSLNGGLLYGKTSLGGANGYGTIFSITPSGTFNTLYSFPTGHIAGYNLGSLLLSLDGTLLYGMTAFDGTHQSGTVFSLTTDVSHTYTDLLDFTGANGYIGQGSLIFSSDLGTLMYGMTYEGTAANEGTVFSITTGGVYTKIYGFQALDGASDNASGANPNGDLLLSGTTLYGMTYAGGSNGLGTIFGVTPDGTFSVLHTFSAEDGSGYNSDGGHPYGNLIVSGSTLYGMTAAGGANGYGTIFSVKTDGTFNTLMSFSGAANGANGYGNLILSGSMLYGMSGNGGANSSGTIFGIPIN